MIDIKIKNLKINFTSIINNSPIIINKKGGGGNQL